MARSGRADWSCSCPLLGVFLPRGIITVEAVHDPSATFSAIDLRVAKRSLALELNRTLNCLDLISRESTLAARAPDSASAIRGGMSVLSRASLSVPEGRRRGVGTPITDDIVVGETRHRPAGASAPSSDVSGNR
jgi:hypothetical protein